MSIVAVSSQAGRSGRADGDDPLQRFAAVGLQNRSQVPGRQRMLCCHAARTRIGFPPERPPPPNGFVTGRGGAATLIPQSPSAAAVGCTHRILLMSSRVTGRSLSPIGKEIAGLLPVSTWNFQGGAVAPATTMRDQDGPSPART